MSIASDKIRVSIVIEKEDKLKLEKLAKTDDRSLNYVINKAIKEYLNNFPNI